MSLVRGILVGPPHTYLVQVSTALGVAAFAGADEAEHLLRLVARLRQAFDLRIYGYLISATGVHLILRHHPAIADTDDQLRTRWAGIGGSPLTTISRIKHRFAS